MVIFTHGWDGLAKGVLGVLGLILLFVIADAVEGQSGEKLPSAQFFGLLVSVSAVLYLALWRPLLSPAANYLYARRTLGVRLSWADASRARLLFGVDPATGTWQPCGELIGVPDEDRAPMLLARLDAVERERERDGYLRRAQRQSGPELSPTSWRVLNVIMVATILATILWFHRAIFEHEGEWLTGRWALLACFVPGLALYVVGLPVARWIDRRVGARSLAEIEAEEAGRSGGV
jgi:hypothetical protein